MIHDRRKRNEQDGGRHEIGEENKAARYCRALEANAHDRIGREHARRHGERRRCRRNQHRVPKPERILRLEQQLINMLEGRRGRPERIVFVQVEKLLIRLDRGQRHPVEREKQDGHDYGERHIDRDEAARQAVEIGHAFGLAAGANGFRRLHRFRDNARVWHINHRRLPAAICGAVSQTRTKGSRSAEVES